MSGQWFYEAKAKRHRDKIHGADIIRASMRRKKLPAAGEVTADICLGWRVGKGVRLFTEICGRKSIHLCLAMLCIVYGLLSQNPLTLNLDG
jgi:hypothetical protein